MKQITFIRKGIFPLRRLKMIINSQSFLLRGNQKLNLELPAGEHLLTLKMDFWKTEKRFSIQSNEKVIVKHFCPDGIYIIFLLGCLILASLSFFSLVNPLILICWLLLFFLLHFVFLFLIKEKYFFFEIGQDAVD